MPPVIVAVLVVSSFNPVCPVVYENVNPLSAALTRKTTTVVPPDELLGTYIPISLAVKSKEGNVWEFASVVPPIDIPPQGI